MPTCPAAGAQTRTLRITDALEASVVAGEQRAQEQSRFDQQPQLTSDLIDDLTFKLYGFATEETATGVVLGVPVDAAPPRRREKRSWTSVIGASYTDPGD